MNDELKDIRGCLRHLRTERSRRRYTESMDSHSTMFVEKEADAFVTDEIRILSSKAFRRLSDKAQVTSFPRNPHIRNRASHTAEVVACSINVSEMLGLNTELVRAIALGHDIGHAPFGHPGEAYLAERTKTPFTHEVMGVVIAQHIERRGYGLNLTHEVLDGMMRHSGRNVSETMTPEAWVVRHADKFAYVFADYNDFNRMGFRMDAELVSLMDDFGSSQRERVKKVILELAHESAKKGKVSFATSETASRFDHLRTLMYQVYPRITEQDPLDVLDPIYNFVEKLQIADPRIIVGLMTDRDIKYLSLQRPLNFGHIKLTAVGEILEHLEGKTIDCCNPDLDW